MPHAAPQKAQPSRVLKFRVWDGREMRRPAMAGFDSFGLGSVFSAAFFDEEDGIAYTDAVWRP